MRGGRGEGACLPQLLLGHESSSIGVHPLEFGKHLRLVQVVGAGQQAEQARVAVCVPLGTASQGGGSGMGGRFVGL